MVMEPANCMPTKRTMQSSNDDLVKNSFKSSPAKAFKRVGGFRPQSPPRAKETNQIPGLAHIWEAERHSLPDQIESSSSRAEEVSTFAPLEAFSASISLTIEAIVFPSLFGRLSSRRRAVLNFASLSARNFFTCSTVLPP